MPFRDLEMETGESGTELLNAGILNVKDFDAVGDGTNDDSFALSSAISSANGLVLIIPYGIYRIGNDVTVPTGTNIWFANGAKISVDSGKKLIIAGTITAGLHQIFTGSGTVDINKGSCERIMPQWWGAVGDGATDDSAAIQKAINCALVSGNVGTVYLSNGTYKITTALNIANMGIIFEGDGKNQTRILASGGINGINVTETSSNAYLEAVILRGFRIYNDTNGVGTGINVYGMRHMTIDNVWVGGWYNSAIGFEKGIYCETNPAYYLTIQRCILMRNTYGIYLIAGANDARIDKNDIWYGDYSIYIDSASGVRVTNNTCENYSVNAIYAKDCYNLLATANYFESIGHISVHLAGSCKNASIQGNSNAVQLYAGHEIDDDSDDVDTNRHEDYHIPIKANTEISRTQAGGLITLDRSRYRYDGYLAYAGEEMPQNITMRAISGDWIFTNDLPNRGIDVQTQLNAKSIETPYAGTGNVYGNLIPYSEDFSEWVATNVTVTDNYAVAPNGTLTGAKVYGTGIVYRSSIPATAGDVITFSVWLRGEFDGQYARMFSSASPAGLVAEIRYFRLTPYWKRYSFTTVMVSNCTSVSAAVEVNYNSIEKNTIYIWGAQVNKWTAVTATDDSGIDDKDYLYDSDKDFIAQGIDIGGHLQVVSGNYSSHATITEINTALPFTAGTTAEPAVGATVTGGTSAATGVVVGTVIASGAFATNDAVGWIEIEHVKGAFQAENVTWTGGSCTGGIDKKNCIVRYGYLSVHNAGSSPANIDNGATVYLAPSYMYTPPAYCATYGTAITQNAVTFGAEKIGIKSVIYDLNPPADTGQGDMARLTAGTALVFGDVCYMGSDGKMEKAQANAIATSQVFAICLETISENSTGLFLLKGFIHLHTIAPAWTIGSALPIYLSDTAAGGYDQVAPADTDECVIKIGTAIAADILYFNPDSTIVVHV